DKFVRDGGILNVVHYRWNWEKRAVGNSASDYTSVSNLVTAVADPSASNYAASVEQTIDSEQWMRTLALRRFIGDADSYGYGAGHNMYAYKPQSGLWQLHNFDMEYTFNDSARMSNEGFFTNINTVTTLLDAKLTNMIHFPQF